MVSKVPSKPLCYWASGDKTPSLTFPAGQVCSPGWLSYHSFPPYSSCLTCFDHTSFGSSLGEQNSLQGAPAH